MRSYSVVLISPLRSRLYKDSYVAGFRSQREAIQSEMNMTQLKELLVSELQDLLHAENQIVGALPKMVEAAHSDKLKEAFEKHLTQTEGQVERLKIGA